MNETSLVEQFADPNFRKGYVLGVGESALVLLAQAAMHGLSTTPAAYRKKAAELSNAIQPAATFTKRKLFRDELVQFAVDNDFFPQAAWFLWHFLYKNKALRAWLSERKLEDFVNEKDQSVSMAKLRRFVRHADFNGIEIDGFKEAQQQLLLVLASC